MSEKASYRFEIRGIDCADCAAKLEGKISKLEGISNVSLNFLKNSLVYDCDHDEGKEMEEKVRALVLKEEPEAVMTSKGHAHHHDHEEHHEHHHDHCACAHEQEETATYKYEITGIDCADCAAKLEGKISKLEGISNVSLNFLKNSLVYDCDHDEGKEMEEKVRALVLKEEPEAVMTSIGHSHHSEHHAGGDAAGTRNMHAGARPAYRLFIENIDCADCAANLEHKISELDGISNVSLSFLNSTLTYDAVDPAAAEQAIRDLVAKEEPDATVRQADKGETPEAEEPKEGSRMLVRLAVGAVLFLAGMATSGPLHIVLEIGAYLILGYDVLLKAVKGIGRGQVFDENFLMSIATLAAMYLSDFREAAGVMLFYQIGEYFQDRAVENSRKSIGELMDIRPEYANVKSGDSFIKVAPEEVEIDEVIRVTPGERIPLDGIVVDGSSSLNTASLTGESALRDVDAGDEVISGSVNETGVLEIRVTKKYGDSTVARILDLVENQDSRKAKAENFITKFSRIYTPTVVFAAIAVAIITAFLTGRLNEGVYRACTFLVISCPCALVISVPLSFFAGIGGLSKHGVLVKGANLIEPLSKTKVAVMDKTGTLTKGVFAVTEVLDAGNPKEAIEDAAYAENYSHHPIAQGIRSAYEGTVDESQLSDVNEIAGRGTKAVRNGKTILAGNYLLMKDNGIECAEADHEGTLVYVAKDGVYEGCIVLEDELKEGAAEAVRSLQKIGVSCAIVSGDNRRIAEKAGRQLGIDEVYGECMPEDKVNRVTEFRKRGVTVFVGDGVNDAPVLAAADIGAAMGALGSDAAIEAADVVIMDDRPEHLSMAIGAAKRILRVVNENIYGAITIKILTLILGAFGIANMWWAIFADTGVAILCVINSMRLLKIRKS